MISNISTPQFAACGRTTQFAQTVARPQLPAEQPQVMFAGKKEVAEKKSKKGLLAAVVLAVATFPLSGPLAVAAGVGAAGSALYAARKSGEAKSEL